MSPALTHGNDPERLRAAAEALSRDGAALSRVGETGTALLGVLEQSWMGPDLEVYTATWQSVRRQSDVAAEQLIRFAQLAQDQAAQQERASSGPGSDQTGSPAHPGTPDRTETPAQSPPKTTPAQPPREEKPKEGGFHLRLPSWDDARRTLGDLKDKAVNAVDRGTDWLNEQWRDKVADSWFGRQVQLRLSQGSYFVGEFADWLRDSPYGRLVPLSPVVSYLVDMGGDTLDSWSKYINDPKGTFLDDWNDSGLFGQVATVASVIPIGRLLKKPADDVDDLLRSVLRKDPPGWVDDFAERAAKKDSADPFEASQARLNERANRYVERYGLDKPEDVWDESKIDPRRRGFVVEAAQGGNLPGSYKTWDKLEHTADGGQVATSIKSIDPSAPSYAGGNAVENQLRGYVDEIDAATPQNRGGVSIDPDDLDGRVLEIVTPPEGFTAAQLEQVHRAREYADAKGIDVVVKEYP